MAVFSRLTGPLAAAFLAALLAGCASMAPTPEKAVQSRAAEQWKAKVAYNIPKAYEFLPPSYRATTSLDMYTKSFTGAVQWKGAEVISVDCESEDKCTAHMKIDATISPVLTRGIAAAPLITYFDEVWVREAGQWWLFPAR